MRRLTPVLIFVILFVAAAIYLPGFSKYLGLKRREDHLAREIKRLETEIFTLKQKEHLLKTDLRRLEEVVREELGLVKPGEVIYRAAEENPKTSEKSVSGRPKPPAENGTN